MSKSRNIEYLASSEINFAFLGLERFEKGSVDMNNNVLFLYVLPAFTLSPLPQSLT